jgi:hypothetical protein
MSAPPYEPPRAYPTHIDTTGDGVADSVAMDTTGDGQLDTVVKSVPMQVQVPGMLAMQAQVPPGMQGGMTLQVSTPAGLMNVQIPPGMQPGMEFQFQVPVPNEVTTPTTANDEYKKGMIRGVISNALAVAILYGVACIHPSVILPVLVSVGIQLAVFLGHGLPNLSVSAQGSNKCKD